MWCSVMCGNATDMWCMFPHVLTTCTPTQTNPKLLRAVLWTLCFYIKKHNLHIHKRKYNKRSYTCMGHIQTHMHGTYTDTHAWDIYRQLFKKTLCNKLKGLQTFPIFLTFILILFLL